MCEIRASTIQSWNRYKIHSSREIQLSQWGLIIKKWPNRAFTKLCFHHFFWDPCFVHVRKTQVWVNCFQFSKEYIFPISTVLCLFSGSIKEAFHPTASTMWCARLIKFSLLHKNIHHRLRNNIFPSTLLVPLLKLWSAGHLGIFVILVSQVFCGSGLEQTEFANL